MVIFLNENLMVSEAYLVKFDQLMTQQMFFLGQHAQTNNSVVSLAHCTHYK